MTPEQEALARARTLGWIAEVLLDGWTPRAVAVGASLPWLPQLSGDLAVRHQRVMGAVPLYESVFCGPDAQLGGALAAQVAADAAQLGFRTERHDVEPDHLGLQVAALGFLWAATADALRDGVPTRALHAVREGFAKAHLSRWIRGARIAVSRQGIDELTAVLDVLEELVPAQAIAGEGEDLLAVKKTGLKQVARYLATPARCGAWFALPDIQRIADDAGLACGFGRRVQMLESLLFAAVDHHRLDELAASFDAEITHWRGWRDASCEATRAILDTLAQGGVVNEM